MAKKKKSSTGTKRRSARQEGKEGRSRRGGAAPRKVAPAELEKLICSGDAGEESAEAEDVAASRGLILPELAAADGDGREGLGEVVEKEELLDGWYGSLSVFMRDLSPEELMMESAMEYVDEVDDRSWIKKTTEYPYRCICDLLIRPRRGRSLYVGTAWFAAPKVLVTAGHNVWMHDHGGFVSSIDVVPGRDADERPYGTFKTTARDGAFWTTAGWGRHKSQAHDYGMILLDEPVGDDVGHLGYAVLSDRELRGKRMNVLGYPGAKHHPRPRGPFHTMWGHVRAVGDVREQRIVYDIDTSGGQSGSPLIVWEGEKRFYAAGIHNYGGRYGGGALANKATRITDAVYDDIQRWM